MADEHNGFDKRLRDLEQWKAGTEEWRHAVTENQKSHERAIEELKLFRYKWAGAISVLVFLASLAGAVLAKKL